MSEAIATFTEAEYLALEQRSNLRHEFVGGWIYQMAGGTERHELAIAALVRRLYPAARAARCRVFANRQLLVPAGDGSKILASDCHSQRAFQPSR